MFGRQRSSIFTKRTASIIFVVAVAGWLRFALPAYSGLVTGAAIQKLTVYDGVVLVAPTATDIMEIGNAGRDLASTGAIFLRPNNTGAGTYINGAPGSNIQNLVLTGSLTIPAGKRLCFGSTDCRPDWPTGGGGVSYWVPVTDGTGFTSLKSDDASADIPIQIGDYADGQGVTGKPALELSGTASPLVFNSGVSLIGGLDDNWPPQSLGTGNTTIAGTLKALQSAQVYDPAKGWMNPWSEIWYYGSPGPGSNWADPAYSGWGIDADTFDGAASLSVSNLPYKDLFWNTFYFTYFDGFRNIDEYVRKLCIDTGTVSRVCQGGDNGGKPCNTLGVNPAECPGEERCSLLPCPAATCINLCREAPGQCIVDDLAHCHRADGRCSIHTTWSCYGVRGLDECPVGESCIPKPSSLTPCRLGAGGTECGVNEGCVEDRVFYCRDSATYQFVEKPCAGPADCAADEFCSSFDSKCYLSSNNRIAYKSCTASSPCSAGEFCNDGSIVTYDSSWNVSPKCQNKAFPPSNPSGCDEVCKGTRKCDGEGTGQCGSFGTYVEFTDGMCVDTSSDCPIILGKRTCSCRCWLTVVDKGSVDTGTVPYLDARIQSGGGTICSEQIGDNDYQSGSTSWL